MFKPVTLKNRDELYKFLRDTDVSHAKTNKLSSIYYLIEFEDAIFPVYFMKYENSYFESVCCLVENKMTHEELVSYVNGTYDSVYLDDALKYEETMYIDGVHYIIENPQCRPFLDGEIKVLDILSERECLDWILRNRKIGDKENKNIMKLITKETIGFGDKAVRIQDCTNYKTDDITRLRENDIKLHIEHRLCCVTYGPVIGIRCMVHRKYTKRGKVIHQAIWCKIVGRDDSDEALLLVPYNLVVNTGGNKELYQRKDKLKICDRDIDIICLGIYQDKYAVCSFKYI